LTQKTSEQIIRLMDGHIQRISPHLMPLLTA
jgi:hypothetical protein